MFINLFVVLVSDNTHSFINSCKFYSRACSGYGTKSQMQNALSKVLQCLLIFTSTSMLDTSKQSGCHLQCSSLWLLCSVCYFQNAELLVCLTTLIIVIVAPFLQPANKVGDTPPLPYYLYVFLCYFLSIDLINLKVLPCGNWCLVLWLLLLGSMVHHTS
jgi:hypothetical protein